MQSFTKDTNTLGEKIKFLRTKKKIKQSDLAKGICSVSYLSKVENDSVVPSEDIERLLLERLGITDEQEAVEQALNEDLDNWNSTIRENDHDKADEMFHSFKNIIHESDVNIELTTKYNLFAIHYFVMKKEFDQAEKVINSIKHSLPNFTLEEQYYYNRYVGNYYYFKFNFNEAYTYFMESERLSTPKLADTEDQAYLYYCMSQSATRIGDLHMSISLAYKSLNLYQSVYNLERCVHCHLLLGMNHRKNGNLHDALDHVEKAKKLADSIRYYDIDYIINNNMGAAYSGLGDQKKAIEFYLNSLNSTGNIPAEHKVDTLLNLLIEYYVLNDAENVSKWIDIGLEFIESNFDNPVEYREIFQFYTNLINNSFELIAEKLHSVIIPFFKSQNWLYELSQILNIFAQQQYDEEKYKNAADLFSVSRDCLLRSYIESNQVIKQK